MRPLKMKDKILKFFIIAIILILAIVFVIKFGGPPTLKLYVSAGIGDCQEIPLLCMAPQEKIINPDIDKEYILKLLPYEFPKIKISIPPGFTVVQERIVKVYYKKRKRQHSGAVVYLLHQEPNFFINLFPQIRQQGVKDDYEFFSRMMYARLNDIKNLNDAFFVIVKSIFTPDLGTQRNVHMAEFELTDKKGFISYNLTGKSRYFDCNIVNRDGHLFKLYIKDKDGVLDLDKVLAIVSTLKKTG